MYAATDPASARIDNELREHFGTEVRAGLTTFMIMSYINRCPE